MSAKIKKGAKKTKREIPEEIKKKVLDMEAPEPGKFSCIIIGYSGIPLTCAEILLGNGHKIYGILTKDPEFIKWAEKKGIPSFPPKKSLVVPFLKLRSVDYFFSISNPLIITPEMLDVMKEHRKIKNKNIKNGNVKNRNLNDGTINYHNSYLPAYAGVNSTNWAVMNMEKTHGITWHYVDPGIDTGDIIKQVPVDIGPNDTGISLNVKCTAKCIEVFEEIIGNYDGISFEGKPQPKEGYFVVGKFDRPKGGGVVSFSRDSREIFALQRGLYFGNYENPIAMPRVRINGRYYLMPYDSDDEHDSDRKPGSADYIEKVIRVFTGSQPFFISKILYLNGEEFDIRDFVEKYMPDKRKDDLLDEVDKSTLTRIESLDKDNAVSENFWVKRLADLEPLNIAGTILKKSLEEERDVRRKYFDLPAEIKISGEAVPRKALLFSAFAVILSRYTGVSSFHLGYSYSRIQNRVKGLEGLFAHHVPLRVELPTGENFEAFYRLMRKELKKVEIRTFKDEKGDPKEEERWTYAHDVRARYPELRKLPETLPVGLAFVKSLEDPVFFTRSEQLNLVIPEEGNTCMLLYNPSLLGAGEEVEKTIERKIDHLQNLLSSVSKDMTQKISEIEFVSDKEKEQLLIEFNAVDEELPEPQLLHRLFEDQAAKASNKNKPALFYGKEPWTYGELNGKANASARLLREKGVGPGSIVAVMTERSMELFAVVMAVLKSGAACLPVDPGLADDHIKHLLEDSNSKLVLTWDKDNGEVHFKENESFKGEGTQNGSGKDPGVNDPAIIMYAALPGKESKKSQKFKNFKGFKHSHGFLTQYLLSWFGPQGSHQSGSSGTWLLKAPSNSAVWVTEMFAWFHSGGSLMILEQGKETNSVRLLDIIEDREITHVHFSPKVFNQLVYPWNDQIKTKLPTLKYVFLSGEPLGDEYRKRFEALDIEARIENVYCTKENPAFVSAETVKGEKNG